MEARLEVGDEEVVGQEEVGGEEARLEKRRMEGGGEEGIGSGGAALEEGRVCVGRDWDGILVVVVVVGGSVETTGFHGGRRAKTRHGRRCAQRHCGRTVGCTRSRGLRVWLERLSLSGRG